MLQKPQLLIVRLKEIFYEVILLLRWPLVNDFVEQYLWVIDTVDSEYY